MLPLLASLLILTNSARLASSTPALQNYPYLDMAAQNRATELCATQQWSHLDWLSSFYGFHSGLIGENLARYTSNASSTQALFMASPTHRANILNPQFHYIGLGYSPECNLTVELFSLIECRRIIHGTYSSTNTQ